MYFLLFLLPLAVLSLLLYCYRECFYSPLPRRDNPHELPKGSQYQRNRDYMQKLISDFEAVPFEEVYIRSYDGARLFARYYHRTDDAPLQIQCHGYRGTAMRDYCGGSRLGFEAGHNLLVIDQRAQGRSDGRTISFGIREHRDVLCWLDYAIGRFGKDTPVILSGVSMGAATVLMCTGEELPPNVRGVVADSPYFAPTEIIRKVCRDRHLPPALVMPFIHLSARLFGGFSLRAGSPLEAVEKARIPILIIHGEDDRFVPCQMSRELAARTDKIRLETFPDAGHGLSFIEDYERYRRVCFAFFDHILHS